MKLMTTKSYSLTPKQKPMTIARRILMMKLMTTDSHLLTPKPTATDWQLAVDRSTLLERNRERRT
jgi:hypothetical protein